MGTYSLRDVPAELFEDYTAFRVRSSCIEPVGRPAVPDPDDLLHVDRQKRALLLNTEQFVKGLPANDVLLYGGRGTGKSSLVRSLLKPFADKGLRLVQVYKEEIPSLHDLYTALRNRPQYFVLFFDDLSFSPDEDAFRLLKSLLDGDVEERPPNVLVCATSNRRYLMPDSETGEKFPEERREEMISLVERFGIRLAFYPFGKEEYLAIVEHLCLKRGLDVDGETLRRLALLWAKERGSYSGRTAVQFVRDLEGRLSLGAL